MLIEFGVGNYKSFKDQVRFSMVAAKVTSKDKEIDKRNVFKVDQDLSLLKSAAIYGANASGKSNLTAAISFMRRMVLESSREGQAAERIKVQVFRLDPDTVSAPASFEIIFILAGTKYRYGFEVTSETITSEWLFYVPKTKEANFFVRDSKNIRVNARFKEGKGIAEKTRSNALFLSVVAQFNGELAQAILSWFRNLTVISGLNDIAYRGLTVESYEKNEHKNDILMFVRKLDLGIDDIQLEPATMGNFVFAQEVPDSVQQYLRGIIKEQNPLAVKTLHRLRGQTKQGSVEAFDLDRDESEGTKKLFYFAGPLLDALSNGKVLIVDELDARLHPLITRAIIDPFNSSSSNPKNAQLIFTTHDTNLLSNKIFRRDQIWFAEKNREGATDLYSLAEFKVRNDASFDTDYIKGKYGAVPFLGDIRKLLGTNNAEEEAG